MCLGVEEPAVQWDYIVIAVQQVEVLESLCNEEALLNIILGGVSIVNVFYSGITSTFNATMPLQCLYGKYSIHVLLLFISESTKVCNAWRAVQATCTSALHHV